MSNVLSAYHFVQKPLGISTFQSQSFLSDCLESLVRRTRHSSQSKRLVIKKDLALSTIQKNKFNNREEI